MTRERVLQALLAMLFAAAVAGTVFSQTGRDAEHTVRFSFLGSPDDEDYDGALVFEQYVESRSNGRIEVEIYPSGQFCSNERECLEGMRTGVLQVFMLTTGSLSSVFGPGQALDLPYIFRDDAVAECVLDGPLLDELRRAVLEAGLGIRLMVASNTGGWRNFATTDRQLRGPEDVEGLKIRTISAPVQQELVRQLGGNPTPVPWSEVYTALATGVVEGTKNGIQDIVGMQLHEQIRHVTLDGHSYMGGLWWFSEASWRQLEPELQRIVYEGFRQLSTVTRGVIKRREIDAYREFEAGGGTLYVPTTAEKRRFREAAGGLRLWYAEQYGEEWLHRLDAAIEACEAAIDADYRQISRD